MLRTAIEAYHRGGFPGRYKLLTVGEYLHIVPTATRDERGVWVPAESPLETVVSIEGGGRFPDPVVTELLQKVSRASGYRVVIGRAPFTYGIQPRIADRFQQVKARAVLRRIIGATGKQRIWYMMYWIKHRQYFLSVV